MNIFKEQLQKKQLPQLYLQINLLKSKSFISSPVEGESHRTTERGHDTLDMFARSRSIHECTEKIHNFDIFLFACAW